MMPTDEKIIQSLQDSVLENGYVATAMDVYVRTSLGIGPDDDVTDVPQYWDEYTRKLQYYILRMVLNMRAEYKMEEIVF